MLLLHSQINHSFPFPSANLWRKLRKELMDLLATPFIQHSTQLHPHQFLINPKKRQLFVFLFVDWWNWLWSGLVDCCCLCRIRPQLIINSQFVFSFSKRKQMELIELTGVRRAKHLINSKSISISSILQISSIFVCFFLIKYFTPYCYNISLFAHSQRKESIWVFFVERKGELVDFFGLLPPLKFKEFHITE